MIKLIWFIKCILGQGKVTDNSLCWFSNKFFDIHDYFINKGGDGNPSHFHIYRCSNCKKEFVI